MMADLLSPLTAGVSRFFRWWLTELAGLLPAALTAAVRRGPRRLVVLLSEREAVFREGRDGNLRHLGSVKFADLSEGAQLGAVAAVVKSAATRAGEVVLRLPRTQILCRRVELPLAAAENLREVLSFEMDRHTPFQAGEVYFDYRLISKDPAGKRLTVDLAVVARSLADAAVARLSTWGLAPDRLDVVQGSAAQDVGFNLLPVSAMRREGGDLHRATAGAAIVVCGLLAVAFYLPILQKQEILAASEAHLALVQVEAAAAKELSAQVESLLERGRFVVEQKRGRPAVAELLDEVTELLPDHTWIIRFGWTGERLTLSGYSAKPSALIALFEQSDMLSEVRFNSPVTVDQKIGLERFNLSATVARGPEP
jgi:general secretion pathway protein L